MAIDLVALASELTNDPLALGYVNRDPVGNHEKLNQIRTTIQIDRDIIPSYEVLDATIPAEYTAISASEKEIYTLFVSAGEINVRSANTRSALAAMFLGGTTTRTNLRALQSNNGSRAQQLFGEQVPLHRVREVV